MDEEDMSNSAVNFTTDHPPTSTNFTIPDILELNVLGFSFLFALPTNAYVIWLILTGAGSGVAAELFNLNLSICGLLYSVNCLLEFFAKLFPFPNLEMLTQFFLGSAITGSPLFQCLICVERYLAVIHPVTFLKYKPLRYRVICCSAAWIITLASCILCMLGFLMFDFYMCMWFLFLQFFLFLSIQMFCCVAVLRALKQSGPGEKGREREEENHVKKRAFYLFLITTVNTVIVYVPFTVSVLLLLVTDYFSDVFDSANYICFMLGGFVPSVLYLHRVGKLSCLSTSNILS